MHLCTDLHKASVTIREQLTALRPKLHECLEANEHELKLLDDSKLNTLEQVFVCQRAIVERVGRLKVVMEEQGSQLLAELGKVKGERIKELQTRRDRVERQVLIAESLRRRVDQLIDGGMALDTIRGASELLARAEELETSQDELRASCLQHDDVSFLEADMDNRQGPSKLIGRIISSSNSANGRTLI